MSNRQVVAVRIGIITFCIITWLVIIDAVRRLAL